VTGIVVTLQSSGKLLQKSHSGEVRHSRRLTAHLSMGLAGSVPAAGVAVHFSG